MIKIQQSKQEYPQTSTTNDLELRNGYKPATINFPMAKREKKSGIYKILKWDPWQKKNNKKKKNKKKIDEEAVLECIDVREAPKYYYPNMKFYPAKPQRCALKLEEPTLNQEDDDDDSLDSYICNIDEYSTKKLGKTVKFQNDVIVLHFANDEFIEQSVEPLKKELEQQERNKKLRHDVNNPETFTGGKHLKCKGTSYMSHWFKK